LNELDNILADGEVDLSSLFQTFRSPDGLPDNVILQITDFPGDRIAVGTNLGIAIFDAPNDAPLTSLQNLEIFNSDTGYPVKDLTDGQNAMFLDSNEILWAGTGNNKTALVRFDYSTLRKNQNAPQLLFKQLRLNEEVISWQSFFQKDTAHPARDLEELLVFGKSLNEEESNSLLARFKEVEIDSIQAFFPIPQGLILPYRHNHINIDYGSNELSHAKEIEKAYKNLKSTQSQLIQAEKMASLGELTAGIAHEIQNLLNFVNNFSEVSAELILEMNEEMASGNLEDAKIIAEDIRQNLDRITLHGRRADSIVKAMLQHSRSGIGQKEKTDINAISEECLRLSYHGIRSKDKEFRAEYLTSLDPSVPQLDVIPRDIRKVLLNIYNNAFSEYDKELRNGGEKNPENGYTPLVSVTTKKLAKGVEIRISDNGKGVPSTIKDKVFQPFFTTKATGKGTGLGLSLSYDIIKAHGGELIVESPPTSGQGEIKQGA
jgi:signal transduction histidine kinase